MKVGDTVTVTNPAACIFGYSSHMDSYLGNEYEIINIKGKPKGTSYSLDDTSGILWCDESITLVTKVLAYTTVLLARQYIGQFNRDLHQATTVDGYIISSKHYTAPSDMYSVLLEKPTKL